MGTPRCRSMLCRPGRRRSLVWLGLAVLAMAPAGFGQVDDGAYDRAYAETEPGLEPVAVEGREGEHPRLFLTPRRLADLRDAIGQADAFHDRAYRLMKQRVDRNDWHDYDGPANNARGCHAREAALVYQITGDSHYAELAYQSLMAIINSPRERGQLDAGNGLDRAAVGLAFAIVYDWCYTGWTEEQRAEVRNLIRRGLDAWVSYGHGSFGGEMVSRWVPVCRGAELVMMLAIYEEHARAERFARITGWLERHLDNAYGPSGISQEGIGSVAYAGTYLLPAVLALRDVGDRALDAAVDAHQWWRLAMYTVTFAATPDGRRRQLPSGVANAVVEDAGWLALLIPTVPPEHREHYLHFYERFSRDDPAGPADAPYDDGRAAVTWALLYRPAEPAAADPEAQMPRTFADRQRGLMLFRSGWRDGDDVLVSVAADAVSQPRSWNQPEALSLTLTGFGNAFVGGPGRQAQPRYFSTLLVDGRHFDADHAADATGRVIAMSPSDEGGYAIVGGGAQYEALGLEHVERHVMVDFANSSGSALIGVLDRIQAAEEHEYAWQLNVGDEVSDSALRLRGGRESGRRTFTLTGPNGGYLKAWVMWPADAEIELDDPLRVKTRNTIADLWVVMLVGRGEPPAASITGEGLDARIVVDGATLRYDRQTGRMASE